MRIGILTRQPGLYSSQRLAEACEAAGRTAEMLDPLALAPSVGSAELELPECDVLIPRVVTVVLDHSLAVIRAYEAAGVPALTRAAAAALAASKFATLQSLERVGLRVPRSCLPRTPEALRRFVDGVGGPPVILKMSEGYGGTEVMRANSLDEADALLTVFLNLRQSVVVQEVFGVPGRDVRVLVVDGECIAAVERIASEGEFRANVHVGGRCEPAELSAEERALSADAAAAVGLTVAGVDLLRSDVGAAVMEVNACPGLKGVEEATGVDVAARIVDAACQLASGA